MATRLMSSGAAKSGKPCERLTAPYFMASRVISRMTDSVNCGALRETRRETADAGELIMKSPDEARRDYFICRLRVYILALRAFEAFQESQSSMLLPLDNAALVRRTAPKRSSNYYR